MVSLDQITAIHKSGSFPMIAYVVAHNLTPALHEVIRDSFSRFDGDATSLV
jgi:hypothetical protein